MKNIEVLDEGAIFRRTADGQRELLRRSGALVPSERRLLGVVTGLTPIGVLTTLGLDASSLHGDIRTLIKMGLIERVVEPATRVYGSTGAMALGTAAR